MRTRKTNSVKPVRSRDVPATAAMLYEMEERLNTKIDSRFHEVKSEVHGLKSEMQALKSEMHRIALLTEEQNARNKFVMDGYAQIYELLANKV